VKPSAAPRRPSSATSVVFASAFVGVIVAYLTASRPGRCIMIILCLTILCLAGSLWLGFQYRVIFNPFVPALSMILGSAVMSTAQWTSRSLIANVHQQRSAS
jgi:CHASE2 domain-containing sensor protein